MCISKFVLLATSISLFCQPLALADGSASIKEINAEIEKLRTQAFDQKKRVEAIFATEVAKLKIEQLQKLEKQRSDAMAKDDLDMAILLRATKKQIEEMDVPLETKTGEVAQETSVNLSSTTIKTRGRALPEKPTKMTQDLSPEASAIFSVFTKESEAIQRKVDEQIAKSRRNCISELESLKSKLTTSGRLEDAVQIRDLIRKLEGFVELGLFQHPGTLDYLSAASRETIEEATKKGYKLLSIQGLIHAEQAPNTIPLLTYWDEASNDYATFACQESIDSIKKSSYRFIRVEGYVYSRKHASTLPMVLFWNGKDNVTVPESYRPELEKLAFKRIRMECWIY